MYKPQIKDKHSLVDLATYGSKARRKIHSEVLVGKHDYPPVFKEGDILDANATFNLIQDTCDQEKIKEKVDQLDEKVNQLEDKVDQLEDKVDQLEDKVDQLEDEVDEKIADAKNEMIEYYSIPNRYAYDGIEESLFIIR